MFSVLLDAPLPVTDMVENFIEDYWLILLLIAAAVAVSVVLIVKLAKKKTK